MFQNLTEASLQNKIEVTLNFLRKLPLLYCMRIFTAVPFNLKKITKIHAKIHFSNVAYSIQNMFY